MSGVEGHGVKQNILGLHTVRKDIAEVRLRKLALGKRRSLKFAKEEEGNLKWLL